MKSDINYGWIARANLVIELCDGFLSDPRKALPIRIKYHSYAPLKRLAVQGFLDRDSYLTGIQIKNR
jgi:hypothetical protein